MKTLAWDLIRMGYEVTGVEPIQEYVTLAGQRSPNRWFHRKEPRSEAGPAIGAAESLASIYGAAAVWKRGVHDEAV